MDLIAQGRDADVYALADDRVLRRYRDPRADATREAEVMAWVEQHGLPVPRVYSVDGPDMVLERLEGGNLIESVVAGTATVESVAVTMANLHRRLHAVPPPADAAAGEVIRHLDLHPLNIIEGSDGPVLIDWRNSDVGPALVDTALTAVILAQVAIVPLADEEVAPFGVGREEFGRLAGELARLFRRNAEPFSVADVDAAIVIRSRDPHMTAEEQAALSAVPEFVAD